jgi:hypothetical protein
MCCLIVVAHHRYLPAPACSRHLDGLWPPVSPPHRILSAQPLRRDWQRRRAGKDGSGNPGRQTLGRNEDALASLCFAACQRTNAETGLVFADTSSERSRAGSALSRLLAGWHGNYSSCSRQYRAVAIPDFTGRLPALQQTAPRQSTQQGAQHGRVHAPVRRGGSWQPDAVAGVLRPRSAGAMPTE